MRATIEKYLGIFINGITLKNQMYEERCTPQSETNTNENGLTVPDVVSRQNTEIINAILKPNQKLEQNHNVGTDNISSPFQKKELENILNHSVRPKVFVHNLTTSNIDRENLTNSIDDRILRRFAFHNKRQWESMLKSGGAAPRESILEIINMLKTPGTKLIEVQLSSNNKDHEHVSSYHSLGFGIVRVLDNKNAWLLGAFNTHNLSTLRFPPGYIMDLMMDQCFKVTGDRVVKTQIVEAPIPNQASRKAADRYGLKPTNEIIREKVIQAKTTGIREQDEEIDISSRVYIRDPNIYTHEELLYEQKKNSISRKAMQWIASSAALTAAYGTHLVWTNDRTGQIPFLFAKQQENNSILAAHTVKSVSQPYQYNLEYIQATSHGKITDDLCLNGIVILPEIFSEVVTSTIGYRDFLKEQIQQLKYDGEMVLIANDNDVDEIIDLLNYCRSDLRCRINRYTSKNIDGEIFHEIILKKIDDAESIAVIETRSTRINEPKYLKHRFFRNKKTGEIRELASRTNPNVLEIYPHFTLGDDIWLFVKKDYPRPITQAMYEKIGVDGTPRDTSLNGSVTSGFMFEAIAGIRNHKSASKTLRALLKERTPLSSSDIISNIDEYDQMKLQKILPSASMLDEYREEAYVTVKASAFSQKIEQGYSGLPSSGIVEPHSILKLLSNCWDGNITNASVTNAAYKLLNEYGLKAPIWGGPHVELSDHFKHPSQTTSAEKLFTQEEDFSENNWEEISDKKELDSLNNFFEIWSGKFGELNSSGKIKKKPNNADWTVDLEYVVPAENTHLSNNTIPIAMCYKVKGKTYFAFEKRDDLPLTEILLHQNSLACCYAFRVDNDIKANNKEQKERFIESAIKSNISPKIKIKQTYSAGPELYVSNGITPERIFPNIVEVDPSSIKDLDLQIVEAEDLLKNMDKISCGHTIATMWRAFHALGILHQNNNVS